MAIDDGKKKATGAGTVGGAAVGGIAGGAAAGAAAGGMTGPVGAAVGAAVGAGVGALSGRAAADQGGSGAGHASHGTVIGAFDDEARAQRAVQQLVSEGFDRSNIHVERGQAAGAQPRAETTEEHPRSGGFFSWLFGEDDTYEPQRNTYNEAVRRGSSVVVVDVDSDQDAERAVACLHGQGAINVDERAQQWRAEGWTDRPAAAASDVRSGGAAQVGKEGVLDVIEEQLQVGKRALDKGGVRVIQRVSQKPVSEVVRLREERAVVDRRVVDRPATAGDLDTFKEGTLEVREMAEEPVVAKTARVVEEVRVGKEVREREETVEDTVRRKDVEVQRMEGSRSGERERAVAADNLREDPRVSRDDRGVSNERDIGTDAGRSTDLTGKPRKNL
jgi:stress response protein YsnF